MMNVPPPPSRSAKVDNVFVGDGEYTLRLGIGELQELQEKTGVGPQATAFRLSDGTWMVADVREPIRLGLIGGGMDHYKAYNLVNRYVVEGYLIEYLPIALGVLLASLNGVPDEIIEDDGSEADPMKTSAESGSSVGVDYTSQPGQQDTPPAN